MTGRDGLSGARVLIVGQNPLVLEAVAQEVADAGVEALRATASSANDFIESAPDLVVFGAGVPAQDRQALERAFRSRRPATRFLQVYAPYAAHQILRAVRQADETRPVDLEAYCARIGYSGPLEPTLDVLRALQQRHVATITFEALDALLDRGIDLSPSAVDAKLIHKRRGGYCYEQNGLFKRVLAAVGFAVDGLLASVRWMNEPASAPPPRSHMALRVTMEGVPWLADVGFGSAVPTVPLRMDLSDPQSTPHETYRVTPFGAGLLVQIEVLGRWQPLYDVSLEPQLDGHYELYNWFTATHPSSHFRNRLVIARSTPEARHSLLDGRLTTRSASGSVEREFLDAKGIWRALNDLFGLPAESGWWSAVERAAARTVREAGRRNDRPGGCGTPALVRSRAGTGLEA
ncbi:arylamine N-acetyltransferase [Sphingosinicella sp. CPCC 101087]|uniref:arylamine N-acetyltransferase family protein n=1 Tax=Sphingosinicella sp. CPCC 101087 TaxID=2497754 RepID=UPI00101CC6E7|nr:arylamine N-acetyltransferase [Sphingosinicella sp. CPCC 101087]